MTITEPPIFWDVFVKEQCSKRLGNDAAQCFSWLLLQLISLPPDKGRGYHHVASDPLVQKSLLESPQLNVRIIGQRIVHILGTILNPEKFESNGPGGRHDNDFVDIRDIAIFPSPEEIASKEPPYLRRATEVEDSDDTKRLAVHIDNQFRILRDDMLRDLRDEVQIALGSRKGRRRGLLVNKLVVEGLIHDGRQPWMLRLQCLEDLPQLLHLKRKDRKDFIVEHRNLLKHQSLACLLANAEVIALVSIYRDEDLLARQPPVLCVQFTGRGEIISKALVALKEAKSIGIIQLSTAMFAYEPVLSQLQNIKEMALKDEIFLWTLEKPLRKTTMSKNPSIIKLADKLLMNSSCELQETLQLPKSTQLDNSQAKCLREGLTQCLSLVQGPPGKSLVILYT